MHVVELEKDLNLPHHTANGFKNPWMNKEDHLKIRDRIRWRVDRFLIDPVHKSGSFDVPVIDPRTMDIPERFNSTALTWVGHSTYLIQIDDVNILADPVWSSLVGPRNKVGPKRKTPVGVPWKKLPHIDAVVISHSHYDHLDEPTVKNLCRQFDPVFIVPLGVKGIMAEWGLTNIREYDWWQSTRISDVHITCTPAQHTSRRGLLDVDETLWSGWLISGRDETVYFAGDTGYFPGFKEIRDYSKEQIDVAIMPIGAYKPRWYMKYMHMDPRDSLLAFRDLDARFFAGMHWGAFDVADESLDDPPKDLLHAADSLRIEKDSLWMFSLGETRIIPE